MASGRRRIPVVGFAVLLLVAMAVPPAIAAASGGRPQVADPWSPAIHEGAWEALPGMRLVVPMAGTGGSAEPADPSPGSAGDTSGDPGWQWLPSFSFALILAATGVLFFAAARARRSRRRS